LIDFRAAQVSNFHSLSRSFAFRAYYCSINIQKHGSIVDGVAVLTSTFLATPFFPFQIPEHTHFLNLRFPKPFALF
jgi:hypothetical protein